MIKKKTVTRKRKTTGKKSPATAAMLEISETTQRMGKAPSRHMIDLICRKHGIKRSDLQKR